ncbi:hypothetical protein HMPREF1557_02228 [Streptococcus sobrinus W1703]|uniref:Uncharacterized protein n=1 Tax=Streptococcus sobrinus W1703 TaxID=1227275 RepID=U2IID8_9STRE|nr:hypothetical protein HMPREF1557_02228 [Streptococcus sobrinus W1703]
MKIKSGREQKLRPSHKDGKTNRPRKAWPCKEWMAEAFDF